MLALAIFAACRVPASDRLTLLFLHRSPAALLDGLSWAPDPDRGRLVAFDGALHAVRTLTNGVSQPVAVSPYCGHLAVSEYAGGGELLDTAGNTLAEWSGPFPFSLYAAAGCRLLASRSPYVVPRAPSDSLPTLVRILDSTGHGTVGLVAGRADAGALAVDSLGGFYFAARAGGVTAYGAGGIERWHAAPDSVAALGLGPDGRLYAFGADLDVLDTARGTVLSAAATGPRESAVAVDSRGAVHLFNGDSLLDAADTGARAPFTPAFALPDLAGDTVRLAQFAGKVTLVNFWASWCAPCRDEFPHMAGLVRRFGTRTFAVVAISDDADPARMRAFVARFHPPFPVLAGGGRMRAAYHYRGLPFSVLLDRRGRVVERIFGFGGTREFRDLSAAIAKEIAAP